MPGSGLIAAGRRRAGLAIISVLGLALVVLGAMALVGDPVRRWAGAAVDPAKLLVVAVVAAAVALAWIALILVTTARLRKFALLTGGQRGFVTLVVTALVVGVALPAYKVSSYAMIQRDLVTSVFSQTKHSGPAPNRAAADPWAKVPRLNVLLIGSDAGVGRTGTRPDSLILASIDTKSGNTVLFSLPRNLERVPFAEGSPGAEAWPYGFYCPQDACLLNAVWQWGEQNAKRWYPDDPNPGLSATEQAVEGVLGLKVDYYTLLNLQGFQDFVDAIGGVRVDVHERLPIGGNSKNRRAEGWIEPGENKKLNGFNALWFARSRWTTDDYDRMRRQRCVIGAAVSQADPSKLALNFPKIAAATKKNLGTDIPQQDLQAWVTLALRIQKGKVASLPFTDKVIPDRANPDYDSIRDYVDEALAPKAKPSSTPSASASAGTRPKSSKERAEDAEKADPTQAQDIKSVC